MKSLSPVRERQDLPRGASERPANRFSHDPASNASQAPDEGPKEKREERRAEERHSSSASRDRRETRNDAVSAQSAWSPGRSLRTRRLWRDEGNAMLLFSFPQ